MSIATLMRLDDPNFDFDHDQFHQTMSAAIPATTTPYVLYPAIGADVPSGDWQTAHAQAHEDFASGFPVIFWPSTASIVDINLAEGANEFWTFSNWQLHNIAASVLPPSLG